MVPLIAFAIGLPLAVALVVGILYPPLLTGSCEDDLVSVFPSPEGSRSIAVMLRDCGATTDYATHVGVTDEASDLPEDDGCPRT